MQEIKLPKRIKVALGWIIPILDDNEIRYQICGGLCARFYGSKRRINDIDIDIGKDDFEKVIKLTRSYIISGPEEYVDKKWRIYLLTLAYHGQIIEFGNADDIKISNEGRTEWFTFKYDLKSAVSHRWEGGVVKLLKPELMINYKQHLDGQKQKEDIEAIKDYMKNK